MTAGRLSVVTGDRGEIVVRRDLIDLSDQSGLLLFGRLLKAVRIRRREADDSLPRVFSSCRHSEPADSIGGRDRLPGRQLPNRNRVVQKPSRNAPVSTRSFKGALSLMLLGWSLGASAAIDLQPAWTGDSTYTPGCTSSFTPDCSGSYTLTIQNAGATADTAAKLDLSVPAGVTFDWTCTASGTGSSCPAASGSGASSLAETGLAIGASGSLTYQLTGYFAANLTAAPLTLTTTVTDGGSTATDVDNALTLSLHSVVSVDAQSTPITYTPGGSGAHSIVVTNAGPSDVSGVALVESAPAGSSIGTWTCSGSGCPANGSGNLNLTGIDLAAGGSQTYTINVNYAASASADPITHSASITVPAAANDSTGTHSDSVNLDRDARTDFGLVFSPASTAVPYDPYIPGSTANALTLTVTNAGPSDAQAAQLALTMPAGVASTSAWSCNPAAACSPSSGNGDVSTAVTLAASGSVDVELSLDYNANASSATIAFSPTLTLASGDTDDDAADNTPTNTYAREVHADYGVSFSPASSNSTTPTETYVPGTSSTTLDVVVSNAGPSDGGGADLTITLPSQLTGGDWTCAGCGTTSGTVTGSTVTVSTGSIAASGQKTLQFTNLAFDSAAVLEVIEVAAEVVATESAETDDDSANDTGSNYYGIDRQADIELTKTAYLQAGTEATEVARGNGFYYDIVVTNHGPSDIGRGGGEAGVTISDTLDPRLQGDTSFCGESSPPCWEFCANETGPGTIEGCVGETTSGTGQDLSGVGMMIPAGASRVLRVHVASALSTSDGDVIDNFATGAAEGTGFTLLQPPGTPDTDSASVTVRVQSNLSVAVTDAATTAVPGEDHSYTVTVRNDGFVHVNAVSLDAALPVYSNGVVDAGFVGGSIQWQCTAFDGACCNSNTSNCGVGTPTAPVTANTLTSHLIDLPAASHVVFTATGRIDSRASGDLSSDAQITIPNGVSDANPADNSSLDDDTTLVPEADLLLDKRLVSIEPVDGQLYYHLVYSVDVENRGPSRAMGVHLSDPLSDSQLDVASASWCSVPVASGAVDCSGASPTAGAFDATFDLVLNQKQRFLVEVDTTDAPSGQITNEVSLDWGAVAKSDTVISNIGGEANLEVTNTDGRATAVPGTENEYVIRVANHGPSDVFGARVTDLFPPKLEDVSWTCSAITPIPGDLSSATTAGPGGSAGAALVTTNDGRHVYQLVSVSGVPTLLAYTRNNVPGLHFGELTELETETNGVNDPGDSGTTVTGMEAPIDIALSTNNAHIYVLSNDTGGSPATANLVMFNRITNPADPGYGKISFAASVPVNDANPRQVAVGDSSLYVSTDDGIRMFTLDPSSGLPGEDELSGPSDAVRMAISPTQKLLFVATTASPQLHLYRLGQGGGAIPAGRIAELDTLADSDLGGIVDLRRGPEGAQLYAMGSTTGKLAVVDYTVDESSGSLSLTTSYAVADIGGSLPANGFQRSNRMAVSPDGEHLLVSVAASNQLLQLRRDTVNGTLTYETLAPRSATGSDPGDEIRFSADGRHVLVALGATTTPALEVFGRRAPDPRFALVEVDRQGDTPGPVQGINAPADIATSPDGKHLYAVSLGGDHALAVFSRHDVLGQTPDSAGQHLQYVTAYFDGVGGVQGLGSPRHILVSPNGANVYVTSADDDSLAVFSRDANTGLLTFQQVFRDGQGGVTALLGATGMAMDAGSSHLYVAAENEQAIAIFRNNAGTLSFVGEARAGVAGVLGLERIHDLTVTTDGKYVLGVSRGNTGQGQAVVFVRDNSASSPNFGRLQFLQSVLIGAQLPTAISLSRGNNPGDDEHVYISAEGSHEIVVLSRNLNPGSADYGKLLPRFDYLNDTGGITNMRGPKDIKVSRDGRKVYVAAASSNAVLVFDRDANRSSASFGALSLVETRRDNLEGVDGIGSVYALAVSPVSSFVYAAGFSDAAIASFQVGSGSSCSASGSGDIDDLVNIANNGVLEYRASTRIRADAMGDVTTTASVELPDRFSDPVMGNNAQTDVTTLNAEGDLSITKSNNQVSVVGGETVQYEVVVRNAGPSNLGDPTNSPVTVSDLLDSNPGFVSGTATWTCLASNSGSLDFVDAHFDGDPDISGLAGASGTALLSSSGSGEANYLVVAGVLDDAITVFAIDPGTGTLTPELTLAQGDSVDLAAGGTAVLGSLEGARAAVASKDGEFLYVASRTSDAVTVFAVDDSGPTLALKLVEVQTGVVLNQAQHLLLSPAMGEPYLYVAAANADDIVVYERDAVGGGLSMVETETNGVDDPADSGGVVAGLDNVEYLVASPDGAQLYALSASSGSISRFDINAADGRLNYRSTQNAASFGVAMDGAAAAHFDALGKFLYVAATQSNRILVLERELTAGSNFGRLTYRSNVTQGVGTSQGLLGPRRVGLSGDGDHLYITTQAGDALSWYLRDPVSGALSYLGQRSNSSGVVVGLAGASGLAIDDMHGQVYVTGSRDGAVAQFHRQADSYCPPSGPGSINAVPVRIAAGGSVTFLINVQVSPALSGSLTNTATVDSGSDTTPGNNSAEDVDPNSSQSDLSITKSDGLAEYDGLAGAVALAADRHNLYVAGATDNAIGMLRRIDDPGQPGDGDVEFLGVLRNGDNGTLGLAAVNDLVIGGSGGQHVYAVSPEQNSVSVFRRAAADGRLTYVESEQNGVLGVSGLSGARALAVSGDGGQVYVLGGFSNAIAVFSRNTDSLSADFGKLDYRQMLQNGVSGVSGMGAPIAVAVAPDGRHVYVLGAESDSIAVFQRNPNPGSAGFGQLSFLYSYADGSGAISGMEGVRSLLLTDDQNLYVLAAGAGRIFHFGRATDGSLSYLDQVVDGQDSVTGLLGASRLRATADASQIYVASTLDSAIVHFDVGMDGSLTFGGRRANGDPAPLTGGQVLGLGGVSDVALAHDGARVYSVSAGDDALDTFDRASADGALDYVFSMFDGLGGIAPGETVTYRIQVRNDGPSDTRGRVIDNFPDAFDSASWTCSASGSAACPASGNGNLDVVVDLPVGSSVLFLASGVIGENASGHLVNTATVSAMDAIDPDETDNSATDGDTVLSPATDLVVTVDDGQTEAVPGASVAYTVHVENIGPSYANDVQLQDTLPAALYDVSWTCQATPIAGALDMPVLKSDPLDVYTSLRIAGAGRFAYATGTAAGVPTLVRYSRDPLTGLLSSPTSYSNGVGGISGLDGASQLLLSSDERFLYVAGTAADTIVLFERDDTDGELTQVARYTDGEFGVSGIGGVNSLAIAPGGAYLYAAGGLDSAIAIFQVNASTGELTQSGVVSQAQAGINGLNGVTAIALSDDGSYLFAGAATNASLAAFQRNAGTGALTLLAVLEDFQLPVADQGALSDPQSVAIHDGAIVVASTAGGQVSAFSLHEAGGSHDLSLDWRVGGFNAPLQTAYDTDQSRLYVVTADGISLLSLQTSSPLALADYSVADHPELANLAGMLISPNKRQLYALGNDVGAISIWQRERGSRCPLSGEGALAGETVDIAPGGAVDITLQGTVFANANGHLVYAVTASPRSVGEELNPNDNTDDDDDLLIPAPDLSAAKTDGLNEVVAGESLSYEITFANAGVSDALVALFDDPAPIYPVETAGLEVDSGSWTCSANAPLALAGSYGTALEPAIAGISDMVSAPDGSRLYAVSTSGSALLVLERMPDGSLSPLQVLHDGDSLGLDVVSGLGGASSVAVTPDGLQLFVTGSTANSLVVFDIDADTGDLSFRQQFTSGQGGVVGLLGGVHVEVSTSGEWAFVAAPGADSIAMFHRDPDTGDVAYTDRVRDGIGSFGLESDVIHGVADLRIDRDGRHLFAVARTSRAVSWYEIDASSRKLLFRGVRRQGEAGMDGLVGARAFAMAPGDVGLYVLGDTAINLFVPQADGSLQWQLREDGIPDLVQATGISLDGAGSRLYLADAGGMQRVFARDWSDGSLDLRFSLQPAGAGTSPRLLYVDGGDLYALSAVDGLIDHYEEQAISRCLTLGGVEDQPHGSIDLGVGGWGSLTFGATVDPSARGILSNSVVIGPSDGTDPQSGDNIGTDTTQIIVVSDLGITKSGAVEAVAGEAIVYQIHVDNAGPSSALGATVFDDFANAIISFDWTCTATAGSSCAASGSGTGDLSVPVDILPGGSVDLEIHALIDPSYLGPLDNQATMIPEPGATDPNPGNDASDSPTAAVHAEVDLTVSKSNGVDEVVAGTSTSYQITVFNNGPSDAPQVRIEDLLPMELASVSWSCAATGSGSCPASGTGDLDFSAAIPAGEQLDIVVNTFVLPESEGAVVNTVTATIEDEAIERQPSDNQATDTDSILIQHDVRVEITAGMDPFDPGGIDSLPLTVRVVNDGPSTAHELVLTLDFSASVQLVPPTGCSMVTPSQMACDLGDVSPNGVRIFELALSGLPPAPGTFTATATAVAREADTAPPNNVASVSVTLVSGGDIEVSIDNGRDSVSPGDALEYEIIVENRGSQTVSSINVTSAVQAELQSPAWTCTASAGVSCSSGSGSPLSDVLVLARGQRVTYRLTGTVDPSLTDGMLPILLRQEVTADTPVGADFRPANNVAVDEDLIYRGLFADGFEDVAAPRTGSGSDFLTPRECALLGDPDACNGSQSGGETE